MIIQREDILADLDSRMDDLTSFYILMAKARPLDFLSDTFTDTPKSDAPKNPYMDMAWNLMRGKYGWFNDH